LKAEVRVRPFERFSLQPSNPSRLSHLSRAIILQGYSLLVTVVQTIEVLLCRNGISAACEIKNPTVFWQRVSLIDQGFFSVVAKGQKQLFLIRERH
jgi:hypothetical protein